MKSGGASARRWSTRAFAGGAALVMVAVGLGACGSSSASDDGALRAAQSFVAESTGFRFESVLRSTYRVDPEDVSELRGDEDTGVTVSVPDWAGEGPGSTTTDRIVTTGSWTSDAWQASADGPFGHTEERVFGSTAYSRGDFDGGSGKWIVTEISPYTHQDLLDELESMRDAAEDAGDELSSMPGDGVDLAAALYLQGGAAGSPDSVTDPAGFLDAIRAIAEPTSTDGEGAVSMSAELTAPADVEEAWGAPLPPGQVTLTVDGDGVPTAFRLRVEEGGTSFDLEVRFSEWNVATSVVRPGDDEIDRTPWIDEEAIAAVPGVQLVRPAAVPEGWELDSIMVVSGDDSPEGCDQIEIDWSPMVTADSELSYDYLSLYLLPLSCAMGSDATPFEIGGYAPLASRDGSYSLEVLVGDTVVQIDSTLDAEQLDQLVRSFEVTDLGSLATDMALGSTMMLTS